MISRTLPAGTTLRSLVSELLPADHAANVSPNAGSAKVSLKFGPDLSFALEVAGARLVVRETRQAELAPLQLSIEAETAQLFLDDWLGPQKLAPQFEPRGIAALTDPKLLGSVSAIRGVIALTLDDFEGRSATMQVASGPNTSLYDDPDATVRIKLAPFLRILSGKLSPEEAIVEGHVSLTGKKLLAMQYALALAPTSRRDSDKVVARMRKARFPELAGWALALFLLAGCRHKVTPADCTRMLDRYLDMTIAADPSTKNLPPAQAAAVRDMKRAVKKGEKSYAQVEARCETEVSTSEYDCAMKANVPDEWEACIE